jgi:hypothetical protein
VQGRDGRTVGECFARTRCAQRDVHAEQHLHKRDARTVDIARAGVVERRGERLAREPRVWKLRIRQRARCTGEADRVRFVEREYADVPRSAGHLHALCTPCAGAVRDGGRWGEPNTRQHESTMYESRAVQRVERAEDLPEVLERALLPQGVALREYVRNARGRPLLAQKGEARRRLSRTRRRRELDGVCCEEVRVPESN